MTNIKSSLFYFKFDLQFEDTLYRFYGKKGIWNVLVDGRQGLLTYIKDEAEEFRHAQSKQIVGKQVDKRIS